MDGATWSLGESVVQGTKACPLGGRTGAGWGAGVVRDGEGESQKPRKVMN